MEPPEQPCTPDSIRSMAASVEDSLLPAATRGRYEQTFHAFEAWMREKAIPEGRCNETVLLAYFAELATRFAPSTLWTLYSMLHKTLCIKKGVDIKGFSKLQAFLKAKSSGHCAKKATVFARSDIDKFLREADNEKWLQVKVVACFSLFGACRKSEIAALTTADVQDLGAHILVNIRQSKTGPRSFVIIGHDDPDLNALLFIRKYMALRPDNSPPRLFLGLRNGKCTRQVIGLNTLATYPCKIAEFLKLNNPKAFTSHAFRRSAATWVADSGVDLINLKRFGGWKSDTVAQGYVAESLSMKRDLAIAVQDTSENRMVAASGVQAAEHAVPLNIANCQECIFNININIKQ
jgi:integrase